MTDELYECPAEGCDYGPLPMRSVLGHFSGKSDEPHSGGWNSAKGMLQDTGPVAHQQAPEDPPDAGGSDDPAPDGGGAHPAEQAPQPQDTGGASGGSESLPCCGETVEAGSLPDEPAVLKCNSCGQKVRYNP